MEYVATGIMSALLAWGLIDNQRGLNALKKRGVKKPMALEAFARVPFDLVSNELVGLAVGHELVEEKRATKSIRRGYSLEITVRSHTGWAVTFSKVPDNAEVTKINVKRPIGPVIWMILLAPICHRIVGVATISALIWSIWNDPTCTSARYCVALEEIYAKQRRLPQPF